MAGLALVVTHKPGHHEALTPDEDAIFYPPADVGALARAVRRLIANPGLLKGMRQRNRAAALEEYNWERESTRLLQLYEHLEA